MTRSATLDHPELRPRRERRLNLQGIYEGLRKLKFALLFLVVSSFSGFATYEELRFQLQGVPAEAMVVEVDPPTPDGKVWVGLRAEREGRSARADLGVEGDGAAAFALGSRHEALWLPGQRPRLRIVGHSPGAWLVWVFLACCGGLLRSLFSALRGRTKPEPEAA